MRRNEEAAILAAVAGIILLVFGYSGERSIARLFELLLDIVGPSRVLQAVAVVFFVIASLGGISVLFGGALILTDRVRFGRIFILVGSGAGFFSLVLFVFVNLRRGREEFSFLASFLPVIIGVSIGIVARFRAVARPIREILRAP